MEKGAEKFALTFQPRVHVTRTAACSFPVAQPVVLRRSIHIDLALDLEQRVVPLDGLQGDRRDRFAFCVCGHGHFSGCRPARAFVFGLNGNGGVVAKKPLGREGMRLDEIKDRQERGRSIPDLAGQRRGRKLEDLAFKPSALAVERAMHSKPVEQDRRQQMRTDEAARRGMERRRRLADRLTVTAGKFLPQPP